MSVMSWCEYLEKAAAEPSSSFASPPIVESVQCHLGQISFFSLQAAGECQKIGGQRLLAEPVKTVRRCSMVSHIAKCILKTLE